MMDKAYRVYISDAVRLISENTARYGGGRYVTARFADILDPPEPVKVDDRPAVEIAADIWRRARIGGESK